MSYDFMEYNQLISIRSSPRFSRQGRPSPQLLRDLSKGKERKLFPQTQHESEKERADGKGRREEREVEGGRDNGRKGDRKYFT